MLQVELWLPLESEKPFLAHAKFRTQIFTLVLRQEFPTAEVSFQYCRLLSERLLEYRKRPSHYKLIRNIAEHPKISLQVELPMSKLFWICHSLFTWKFSQGKTQAFITTIWDTWVELLLSSSTEAAVNPEISTMVVPDSTYSIQAVSRRNVSVLNPDTQRVHQMEQIWKPRKDPGRRQSPLEQSAKRLKNFFY